MDPIGTENLDHFSPPIDQEACNRPKPFPVPCSGHLDPINERPRAASTTPAAAPNPHPHSRRGIKPEKNPLGNRRHAEEDSDHPLPPHSPRPPKRFPPGAGTGTRARCVRNELLVRTGDKRRTHREGALVTIVFRGRTLSHSSQVTFAETATGPQGDSWHHRKSGRGARPSS